MADITANQIYPSIKYITTNTRGDLQEITGTDATTASGSLQGITLTSVATGDDANGTTFEITGGSTSDELVYDSASDTISLNLKYTATVYRLNEQNADSTDSHLNINTSDKILITQDGTINSNAYGVNSTLTVLAGEIYDVVSNDGSGRPEIHEGNDSANTLHSLRANEYGTVWGKFIESISNIIATAGTDVTDIATIAISGADSDNLTGSASVTLQGADDATDGELQGNSEYVLIARGDLHSLDSDESTDGRKLLWGLLEKYSDAYYALDSANRPASLTLNKSNFLTQTDGHSLKQTYTVTASYDVNGLDLLAE